MTTNGYKNNSHLPRTTWKCLLMGMDNWGTGLDMTASGFAKILNLREREQNHCDATFYYFYATKIAFVE